MPTRFYWRWLYYIAAPDTRANCQSILCSDRRTFNSNTYPTADFNSYRHTNCGTNVNAIGAANGIAHHVALISPYCTANRCAYGVAHYRTYLGANTVTDSSSLGHSHDSTELCANGIAYNRANPVTDCCAQCGSDVSANYIVANECTHVSHELHRNACTQRYARFWRGGRVWCSRCSGHNVCRDARPLCGNGCHDGWILECWVSVGAVQPAAACVGDGDGADGAARCWSV